MCLPTWDATIGWATRDKSVLDKMETGYPRFFIHQVIDQLTAKIIHQFGGGKSWSFTSDTFPPTAPGSEAGVRCHGLLFPCAQYAARCESFLIAQASPSQAGVIETLTVVDKQDNVGDLPYSVNWRNARVYAVLFAQDMTPIAKAFWQHTGFGISSRHAELLDGLEKMGRLVVHTPPVDGELPSVGSAQIDDEARGKEIAMDCKLRCDIARLVDPREDPTRDLAEYTVFGGHVYLFSTGMAAISASAEMISGLNECNTIVVYGFLYLDTFKVLSRIYNFEIILYGHSTAAELDELESKLAAGNRICALYCEFPGNPLLRTPDLRRLRGLADKYDFVIVCDDTIGTFSNVNILPHVDVLLTSLTKMFSGGCNVMGGSLIFNPRSKHFRSLKQAHKIGKRYYFPEDLEVMVKNSENFKERITRANINAELLVTILQSHPAVTQVYYPTTSDTLELYEAFKRPEGGYGYLFSVIFDTPANAQRFYDNLNVAKGPSLGTNFTLACPYTLFAHYGEREWAAKYGVVEHLVRISVGLEEEDVLLRRVGRALEAVVVDEVGRDEMEKLVDAVDGKMKLEEKANLAERRSGKPKLGGQEWMREVLAKAGRY